MGETNDWEIKTYQPQEMQNEMDARTQGYLTNQIDQKQKCS